MTPILTAFVSLLALVVGVLVYWAIILAYLVWSNVYAPTFMDRIVEASAAQRRAEQNDPELLQRRAALIEAGAAPRAKQVSKFL